jgi:uncharacterized repeat protein (TIGR03803 family)
VTQGTWLRWRSTPPLLALAVVIGLILTCSTARAQTYTVIYNFCTSDFNTCPAGDYPVSLTQATDGNLYGVTTYGGDSETTTICGNYSVFGCGTAFKITLNGALTTIHRFCTQPLCLNGLFPSPLIQAADGDFYGTTEAGGTHSSGTIFKIDSSGGLTTVHNFCGLYTCAGGRPTTAYPLIQAADGDLYGTAGGTSFGGIVFRLSPSGHVTTVYSFCSQADCADGEDPSASLIQAPNGDFFGTTSYGGSHGGGTVFKLSPNGQLTTLYNFCSQANCVDGSFPAQAFFQGIDGNFYGITTLGGLRESQCNGTLGKGCGTIFKITPGGDFTSLQSFDAADGFYPASLIQATDGNFYGTTFEGGTNGGGTVFELTPAGELMTLYAFCSQPNCIDGARAEALIQATNGELYGASTSGGAVGYGTIFSIDLGLGAFVSLQTNSGAVGSKVTILGTNLIGATGVTFAGTSATFTVNSTGSAIVATVPLGAVSGAVRVITPSGILSSNKRFTIKP